MIYEITEILDYITMVLATAHVMRTVCIHDDVAILEAPCEAGCSVPFLWKEMFLVPARLHKEGKQEYEYKGMVKQDTPVWMFQLYCCLPQSTGPESVSKWFSLCTSWTPSAKSIVIDSVRDDLLHQKATTRYK